MPISFPTSPANGDTHVIGSITYQYDATDDKWTGLGVTPTDKLIEGSNTVDLNGNSLEIGGTPPWSVTGGNYNNLSIRGGDASSSGFMWLGNGTATNNGDFDLGRINFLNGPTIVSQIKGTTETGANDDGRISFLTKSTGNSLTERLRVRTNGIQVTGRIFINGTNAGFDYNSVADTLEVLTTNGSTHSEFNANAFVPQGTKNLGANNLRWNTLYIANGIDFAGNDNASGMTSELLDDYEEGSWTPSVNRTSPSGAAANHTRQSGKYTKIGNVVTIWFDIVWDSPPNGSGDYVIDSLPFSAVTGVANGVGGFGAPQFRDANGLSTDIRIYGNSSYHGTTFIYLQAYNSSGNAVSSPFNSSGRITGWSQYFVNS